MRTGRSYTASVIIIRFTMSPAMVMVAKQQHDGGDLVSEHAVQ
jgi:hypothetical protein